MNSLLDALKTKPGLMTTEFWVHAIVSVITLLVGLHIIHTGVPKQDDALVQLGAFLAAAIASGAYALSRGRTKGGSGTNIADVVHAVLTQMSTSGNPADTVASIEKAVAVLEGRSVPSDNAPV